MPVIIDDCEIPLFLKDKLHADFRKGADQAFELIDRSLARVTNPTTSRVEQPDFFTDFAFVWKPKHIENSEETWIVHWTFVDHGAKQPYVLVSECKIYEASAEAYASAISKKQSIGFIRELLEIIYSSLIEKYADNAIISGNTEQFEAWKFDFRGGNLLAIYYFRRLGADNGMDTKVYLDNNLKMARDHLRKTVYDEEASRGQEKRS